MDCSCFQAEVLNAETLAVVQFWTEWDGPSRVVSPIIEELSKDYDGKVLVGKLNVDHHPQVSIDYGITSIPAILFVKNGQVVDKQIGAVPKAVLEKRIQANL